MPSASAISSSVPARSRRATASSTRPSAMTGPAAEREDMLVRGCDIAATSLVVTLVQTGPQCREGWLFGRACHATAAAVSVERTGRTVERGLLVAESPLLRL